MPCNSEITVSVAGSGKTTAIVDGLGGVSGKSIALVTYTNNGCENLRRYYADRREKIGKSVSVESWYTFILKHFIRPYQACLYKPRVEGILFESVPLELLRVPKQNVNKYFFAGRGLIWRDRVTDFAYSILEKNGDRVFGRLGAIYDKVIIDEAQDLSGWDLEVVEALLRSGIPMKLVGDHRQATFSTNLNQKNRQFRGANIIDKFRDWEKRGLATLASSNESYRCVSKICDFVNAMYGDELKMASLNSASTGHDGVFLIEESHAAEYIKRYSPKVLRYNKTFAANFEAPMNFGDSKGLTFERVLIIPHGPLAKYLKRGQTKDLGKSIEKVYVAVTRAKQSVAFLVPDGFKSPLLKSVAL